MWSATYGLIALAVVAFVLLYAGIHAAVPVAVNLADQLYDAKSRLAGKLPSLPRTTDPSAVNAVLVDMVTIGNSTLFLPLGYRLSAEGRNVLYQVYLNVTRCIPAVTARGEPAVLYEIEMKHSLDILPWVEVYAAVPNNITHYLQVLLSHGRPLALGLDPSVGADAEWGVEWVRAGSGLVYNATSGIAKLYVVAPATSLYIVVVDYPLAVPLTCREALRHILAPS
jgi:hypothetical protein